MQLGALKENKLVFMIPVNISTGKLTFALFKQNFKLVKKRSNVKESWQDMFDESNTQASVYGGPKCPTLKTNVYNLLYFSFTLTTFYESLITF